MPEQPKIQFTPAQAAAISARGGSLLVSAAAGSGKTRVLVERVVGLIHRPVHPVDANQLLIMTSRMPLRPSCAPTSRPAWRRRSAPTPRSASAQPAAAVAACVHRHGGCVLPAFCAAALCDARCTAGFETADEADLARIEQETLAATLETA